MAAVIVAVTIALAADHAAACGQSVRTWISTDSELLGAPTDLAIAPDGALLVLDHLNATVLVLRAPGSIALRAGRQGSGPGELKEPTSLLPLTAGFDVLDAGNNRLQRFDAAGSSVSTRQLPPYAGGYPTALCVGGGIAVNTMSDSLLVTVYGPAGEVSARFLQRRAPMPQVIKVREAREEIRGGKVPSFFRNALYLECDPAGAVWVVQPGDGIVSRWSATGRLLGEHQLSEPEMPDIRRAFFDLYQDPDYRGLKGLSYVADLKATSSGLWLLLDRGDELPAVVLRISKDGKRTGRWTFPAVRGARQLAVDEARGRIFLGAASAAEVVEVPLAVSATRRR